MRLILIRHAIAEDREDFAASGLSDDERPLTDQGRKKMKRAARGLREVVDGIDILATSPLQRAMQTAEIIAGRYNDVTTVTTDSLIPDHPFDEFLGWLQRLEDADTVVAVGHEPHLGSLASWLLTGEGTSRFELKKGSALQLDFAGELKPGGAQLSWLLTPAQLRALGD